MALPTIYSGRQFETTNGALKFPSLQDNPPSLLGRMVHENSGMDSAINVAATEANYLAVYGDFGRFVITSRVGAQVELVSHLVGANRRPTGQPGVWLWMRYGSDSLMDNAFRNIERGHYRLVRCIKLTHLNLIPNAHRRR